MPCAGPQPEHYPVSREPNHSQFTAGTSTLPFISSDMPSESARGKHYLPLLTKLNWMFAKDIDPALTPLARRVLAVMMAHRNKDTGETFVDQYTMADILGSSQAPVSKAIKLAAGLGWITSKRKRKHNRDDTYGSNHYSMLMDRAYEILAKEGLAFGEIVRDGPDRYDQKVMKVEGQDSLDLPPTCPNGHTSHDQMVMGHMTNRSYDTCPKDHNNLPNPPAKKTHQKKERSNGAIVADAPPPSLCRRDASQGEEPASPKGVPMPGYDSLTFAERLPSFATKWPEAEPRPHGIPSEELAEWCETLVDEWGGKKHNVRGAVAELMMLGWSLDQLADPMDAYNLKMLEKDTYTMRLITYLGEEFDVGGKHRKDWEAEKAAKAEPRHRKVEAPAVIEKPVIEAAKAEQVTIEADPIVEQPIAPVTSETIWGEPAWGELEGDDTDEPVEAPQAEPVIEQPVIAPPAAEGKAGDDNGWGFDDAFADMTQAERQAVVAQKAKEVRAKYEADRRAKETPSERADRELAEYLKKRREKEQAEAKRKKIEADRVVKPATAPASIYPLRAPRGTGGSILRMSDYAEATF